MVWTRLEFRLRKVPRGPGNKRMRRGVNRRRLRQDEAGDVEAGEATQRERDEFG